MIYKAKKLNCQLTDEDGPCSCLGFTLPGEWNSCKGGCKVLNSIYTQKEELSTSICLLCMRLGFAFSSDHHMWGGAAPFYMYSQNYFPQGVFPSKAHINAAADGELQFFLTLLQCLKKLRKLHWLNWVLRVLRKLFLWLAFYDFFTELISIFEEMRMYLVYEDWGWRETVWGTVFCAASF